MSYLVDLVHEIRASGQPGRLLIPDLAAAQHGVVARWQLAQLGLGRGAIAHHLKARRLHRVHEGVYAAGYPKLTPRGHWMAAVLAGGVDALLGHRSNAALRGYLPDGRTVIDVTVPGRAGRRHRGVLRFHQPRALHPDDIAVQDGIPCTSVALMLLEVAETAAFRHLERAFEAAERERQLDMGKLRELMDRSSGRPGLRPLNLLLERFREPAPHVRSKLERRFFDLCRARGVELPETNAWIGELEVDMLWRDRRIVVELDGWDTHRTRQAFERDRARDVRLQVMGYRVLRFTWRQLEAEPEAVLAAVVECLGPPG
jgi:very-short-patch-repair endonuclease